MATIRLCSLLSDISGSFGGSTGARDGSGLHLSARRKRVKKRSASQSKVRFAFSKVVQRWTKVSKSPHIVLAWLQFSTYPETAYQAFQRISWYYAYNGLAIPSFPPSL